LGIILGVVAAPVRLVAAPARLVGIRLVAAPVRLVFGIAAAAAVCKSSIPYTIFCLKSQK
jgi:hypothetical protein